MCGDGHSASLRGLEPERVSPIARRRREGTVRRSSPTANRFATITHSNICFPHRAPRVRAVDAGRTTPGNHPVPRYGVGSGVRGVHRGGKTSPPARQSTSSLHENVCPSPGAGLRPALDSKPAIPVAGEVRQSAVDSTTVDGAVG